MGYLELPGKSLFDGQVWNMATTSDGKKLFVGVSNGTVQVFDVSYWSAK